MLKSRATLIRRHLLGETSLILVWCTSEQGLVRTAAKGARGAKSPFAGRVDLFIEAEIAWVTAKKGDLHTLREIAMSDPRLGIRGSYRRTLAASYFTALIEMVAETETPIPELADLLERALDWVAAKEPTAAGVSRFEDRVAGLLGIGAPGSAGAAALLDAFHRLPASRQSLFCNLGVE